MTANQGPGLTLGSSTSGSPRSGPGAGRISSSAAATSATSRSDGGSPPGDGLEVASRASSGLSGSRVETDHAPGSCDAAP